MPPWRSTRPPRRWDSRGQRQANQQTEGVEFCSSHIFGQFAARRPAAHGIRLRCRSLPPLEHRTLLARILKLFLRIAFGLVLVLAVLAFALWMKPPEILRVGA